MKATLEQAKRARQFLSDFYAKEHTYHHHKENMAYAGIALQITIFAGAVFLPKWPPKWLGSATCTLVSLLALIILWSLTVIYIRWQLRRRRRASIRVGAVERLMAKWILKNPKKKDLKVKSDQKQPKAACPGLTAVPDMPFVSLPPVAVGSRMASPDRAPERRFFGHCLS